MSRINFPTIDDKALFDASSPYGYSGPLFNNATETDIRTFWSEVDKWYEKNNVITEFVRFNLEDNNQYYSGKLVPSLSNVVGNLTNFDTIWGNFKQKVRNNYRNAEKNQLTFEIYSGIISTQIIDSFYNIYIETMKRKTAAKNFFYPKVYFEKLISFNPNQIAIAVVYNKNTPISTEFIIINNNSLYSFLGGTSSDFFDLRSNEFLKINVMKWGIENNKKYYVLGGGRKNFDSLYQYKKAFFPKDKDKVFYTGRKIINEKIYYEILKNIEVKHSDAIKLLDNSTNFFPKYKEQKNNSKINKLHAITTKKEWQDVLNQVFNYDFYHTYDYHNLSKLKDEKALLIKYTEGDILIALPILVRKINNTKYYDATSVYGYAGPLQINVNSSFNNNNYVVALEQFFKKENIVSVFSRLNPFINYQENLINGLGQIIKLGNIVNIDLTKNIEEQRTIFSKTTKRYLNKCRKLCYTKKSKEKKDINAFIEIYYENMKRVNAKQNYFFSEEYFFNFINSVDFKTEVLFVIHKETEDIICAAMMVKTNSIIQYHLSGTKTDYLSISPIRLIIDEMRIRGTQDKYKYFNLGGGLGNRDDELFKFKSSFSKDFKQFKIWQYIALPDIYDKLSEESVYSSEDINFFPIYRYQK
ncbi:MAG: GNAT family N-acetyltransferase [Flaviramulus sp.]|nr:GNAT family N-acetyltransferase [Flaviramulus sp.]